MEVRSLGKSLISMIHFPAMFDSGRGTDSQLAVEFQWEPNGFGGAKNSRPHGNFGSLLERESEEFQTQHIPIFFGSCVPDAKRDLLLIHPYSS